MKGLVDENIRGLIVEPLRPSPLEKLLELKPSALERVAARQIMTRGGAGRQGQGPGPRAGPLERPGRSPAIVERVVGDGRVLLWTTTADRAGNDWPIEPSFVLAVREAVRGTARPTSMANTVTAGERMRRVVRSNQPVSNVRLNPPGGGEPRSLSAAPSPRTRATAPRPSRSRSPTPASRGCTASRGTRGRWATSRMPTRPTPTRARATWNGSRPTDVKKLFDPLNVEIASARSGGAALFSPTGREIWRDLACALFVLLIGESIFATWAGRSR